MIREIVIFGDPVLRKVGAKIDSISGEITKLAADMIDTMRSADGVGLAAQQVGVALQIAVVDVAEVEDITAPCTSPLRIKLIASCSLPPACARACCTMSWSKPMQ